MSPLGRIVHKTRTHTVIDAKHPKPDQVNAVQFLRHNSPTCGQKSNNSSFKDRTSDVLRLYLLKIPNVRSSISVLTVFPILLVGLKSESIGAF